MFNDLRGVRLKMSFDSQRDFNKFMDGYMDSLGRRRTVPRGSLFARKPKAEIKRIDRAVALEEKELKEVVEPKEEKEKKKSLLQKLMFFAGDASKQEKEARKALGKELDDEDAMERHFRLDDIEPRRQEMPQRPAQQAQSAPFYPRHQPSVQRPIGPISNGVPISSLRQAGPVSRQPEAREVAQNFPYSPSAEKDIKYLLGLVNTLLNRMEPARRQEFYRSSEYRIFESVRKKY